MFHPLSDFLPVSLSDFDNPKPHRLEAGLSFLSVAGYFSSASKMQ
jgi:hypothetical protein